MTPVKKCSVFSLRSARNESDVDSSFARRQGACCHVAQHDNVVNARNTRTHSLCIRTIAYVNRLRPSSNVYETLTTHMRPMWHTVYAID